MAGRRRREDHDATPWKPSVSHYQRERRDFRSPSTLDHDEMQIVRNASDGRMCLGDFEDSYSRNKRDDCFGANRRARSSKSYDTRRFRRTDSTRMRKSSRNLRRSGSPNRRLTSNGGEPQPVPCVIATVVPGESVVSEVSYRCNFCHFATNNKQLVSLHVNDHLFRCSLCPFQTDRQHELLRHKQLAHNRTHPLPYELLAIEGSAKGHDPARFTVVATHQLFDVDTPKCSLPNDFYVSNVIIPDLCEAGIFNATPVAKAAVSVESYPLQTCPSRCAAQICDNVDLHCGASNRDVRPTKPAVKKVKIRLLLKSNKEKKQLASQNNLQEIFVAEQTAEPYGVIAPRMLTPSLRLLSTYTDSSEPATATADMSEVNCPTLSGDVYSSSGRHYTSLMQLCVDVHEATSLKAIKTSRLVPSADDGRGTHICQTIAPLQTLSILPPVQTKQMVTNIGSFPVIEGTKSGSSSGHTSSVVFSPVDESSSCHVDSYTAASVTEKVMSVTFCESLLNPVEFSNPVEIVVSRKALVTKSPPHIKTQAVKTSLSVSVMEGLNLGNPDKKMEGQKINRISLSYSDESLHAAGSSIGVLGPSPSLPEVSADFDVPTNMLIGFPSRRRNLRSLPSRRAAFCQERRALLLAAEGVNVISGDAIPQKSAIDTLWQQQQQNQSEIVKDGCTVRPIASDGHLESTDVEEKSSAEPPARHEQLKSLSEECLPEPCVRNKHANTRTVFDDHLDLYAFEESNDELDKGHWNHKSGSRPSSSHSSREDEPENHPSASSIPPAVAGATAAKKNVYLVQAKKPPKAFFADENEEDNCEIFGLSPTSEPNNSLTQMSADGNKLKNSASCSESAAGKPSEVDDNSVIAETMKNFTKSSLKRPLQRPRFIQPPSAASYQAPGESASTEKRPVLRCSMTNSELDGSSKSPSVTRSLSLNSDSSMSLSSVYSQMSAGLTVSPQSSFVSVASGGKAAGSISGAKGNKRRRISAPSTDGTRRRTPARERALIRHALNTLLVHPVACKRTRQSLDIPEKMFTFLDLSDAETTPECLLNLPTRHLTPSPVRQLFQRTECIQSLQTEEELASVFPPTLIVQPMVIKKLSTGATFNKNYSRSHGTEARQSKSHGNDRRDSLSKTSQGSNISATSCLLDSVFVPTYTAASLSVHNYTAFTQQLVVLETVHKLESVRQALPTGSCHETAYHHCEVSEISILEKVHDACHHLTVNTLNPVVNTLLISYATADVAPGVAVLNTKSQRQSHDLQHAECIDLVTSTRVSPLIDCVAANDRTSDVKAIPSMSYDSSICKFPTDVIPVESEISSEIATVGDFSAWDTESETSTLWDSSIEVTGEYPIDTDICVVGPPIEHVSSEQTSEVAAGLSAAHPLLVVQAKVAPVIVEAEECATTVEPSLSPSLSSPPGILSCVHEVETFTALASRSHSESPISDHVNSQQQLVIDNADGSKVAGTSYCGLKSKLQLAVQKGALEKKPVIKVYKPTRPAKESKHRRSSSTSRSSDHLKSDESSSKLKKKKKQKKKHKRKHKESKPDLSAPKLPLEHPVSPIGVSHSRDKSTKLIGVHPKTSCKRHKKEILSQEGGLIFYPVPSENKDSTSKSSCTKASSSGVSLCSSSHQLYSEEKKRKSPDSIIHSKHKKIKLNGDTNSTHFSTIKTKKKSKEHNSKNDIFRQIDVLSSSQPKPPWFNNKTITDVVRCNMCDFICLEVNDLVEHKEEIHAVKNMAPTLAPCDYDPPVDVNVQYKCTLCGLSDDHLKRIRQHISSEHGGKLKTCERVTHTRAKTGFSLVVESVRVYKH